MRAKNRLIVRRIMLGALASIGAACACLAQTTLPSGQVDTLQLDKEIRELLAREITAHVGDIKSLDPPPDRVVGALTTGEFSWGTFMRALAAYSEFGKTRAVAGQNVAPMIGKMGLIELRHGGKTWAQLYAAIAMKHFGTDLNHNALWQGLSPEEREAWKALLNPGRFYDAKTHTLIQLPENYFGVAARIAAISYEVGLTTDRAFVDDLLDHAAKQFTAGAIYADDALPTGRYDRYSNEYIRAIYEAAATMGRADIIKALAPSLREQMRLWWDLLAPDGYGYPWGRSLGAISYMDTMEIAAFLGEHPEFRPVALSQLASAYYAAWRWLRNDFKDQTHLLSVFAFGRGDYSYITKEREWQQTTAFLGKVISAHQTFMNVLAKEKIAAFPSQLGLNSVARFVNFRSGPGRQFGAWVIRQDELRFVLPFVTGPRAATSDYEPAPHGLPGMAVPVEKFYPCLTPFLELEDGTTITAADGADEILSSPDGQSVTAKWRHWVIVGANAGESVDPGLVTEIRWSITKNTLHRSETITSSKAIRVRHLWMAVPSTANRMETSTLNDVRRVRLISSDAALEVSVLPSDWPIHISAFATGDDPLGRGARGPIPLHLILESNNLVFEPGMARKLEIELSGLPGARR